MEKEICDVPFPGRRCRLLAAVERRVPALAVARGELSRSARRAACASRQHLVVRTSEPLKAPEADPKTCEEKRFGRYDKNKDGKVEQDEYLAARWKNFDKLDLDHNGALSFAEYAAKGIDKFDAASGRKGWVTAAEFVATAPPPAKRKVCSCGRAQPAIASSDGSDNSADN